MSTDSSARLVIPCGSLLLQTGAVPAAIHADGALIADVSQEISAVRLGSPAVAVVLARGQTTATLLARALTIRPDLREFKEAVNDLGTVDLDDGLGMLAPLGHVAALVALADDHVRPRIDKDLVIPLVRLRNGTLRRVGIWSLNSLAGGVGSMAGALFGAAASASVRELSNAIVDVLSFQVGALTFLGLGDRVLQNAAAGLVEHLALLRARDRDPRESRQLVLTELPTVDSRGNEIALDRALRSGLAIALVAAFACRGAQQRIVAGRTNRALGIYFGGVTLLRGDWFGSLAPEKVVAAAAAGYLGQLDESPDAAPLAPAQLGFIETLLSPELKAPDALAAAAARARGRKPESFDRDAFAGVKYSVVLRLDGVAPERAAADAVESALSGGHGPAMRQLDSMYRAIRGALDIEVISEARESLRTEARKRRLSEAVASLFPEADALSQARRFFLGYRSVARAFLPALSSWREAQRRHAIAAARRAALETAATVTASAIARIKSLVGRLRAALEAIADLRHAPGLACAAIAEVSAGFLRCVAAGDISLLRSQLARSTKGMTAEGLARMIGADSSHPSEIVARLASEPLYTGPYWGGGDPSGPPFFRAIVLPPLDHAYMSALREAAVQGGLGCELLAGDTLEGGAAVVRLEAYQVSSISELFPPTYRSGLRDIAGPLRSLYPLGADAQRLMKELLSGGAVCA